MASADFPFALTKELSPGKALILSLHTVRLYLARLGWISGFTPAGTLTARTRPLCRFGVPTVKGLFPASFGLAARLAPHDFRSAVPYGYLHRSRQDRFILRESAHAGHTGARILACRTGIRAGMSSATAPRPNGDADLRAAATEPEGKFAKRSQDLLIPCHINVLGEPSVKRPIDLEWKLFPPLTIRRIRDLPHLPNPEGRFCETKPRPT